MKDSNALRLTSILHTVIIALVTIMVGNVFDEAWLRVMVYGAGMLAVYLIISKSVKQIRKEEEREELTK